MEENDEDEEELSAGLKMLAAGLEAHRAKQKEKDDIKDAARMAERAYLDQAAKQEDERRQALASRQQHIESLQRRMSSASVQVRGLVSSMRFNIFNSF
jgi:hypothetical protein